MRVPQNGWFIVENPLVVPPFMEPSSHGCEAWEPILEASKIPERPNFYVHCPTRTVEAVEAVDFWWISGGSDENRWLAIDILLGEYQ